MYSYIITIISYVHEDIKGMENDQKYKLHHTCTCTLPLVLHIRVHINVISCT